VCPYPVIEFIFVKEFKDKHQQYAEQQGFGRYRYTGAQVILNHIHCDGGGECDQQEDPIKPDKIEIEQDKQERQCQGVIVILIDHVCIQAYIGDADKVNPNHLVSLQKTGDGRSCQNIKHPLSKIALRTCFVQ